MSRINRLPASPLVAVVQVLLSVALIAYVFAHEDVSAWLPSLFEAGLSDKSYTYWHRWVHLNASETAALAALVMFVWVIVSQTSDTIYKFVRRHPLVPLIVPAAFLVFLVGRDLYAGYAIYDDRIVVRSLMTGVEARTYRAADVVEVEVGCHRRALWRWFGPDWQVPTYKITFRDGAVLSPFDLADSGFQNPNLMAAVLRFDSHVQTAGAPRYYLLDFLKGRNACLARMEGYYPDSVRAQMRQAFMAR